MYISTHRATYWLPLLNKSFQKQTKKRRVPQSSHKLGEVWTKCSFVKNLNLRLHTWFAVFKPFLDYREVYPTRKGITPTKYQNSFSMYDFTSKIS